MGQALDFPGGKVAFTNQMSFISESADKRVPCYRVLDGNGEPILSSNNFVQVCLKLLQIIQQGEKAHLLKTEYYMCSVFDLLKHGL